jgi:hypothetical protein
MKAFGLNCWTLDATLQRPCVVLSLIIIAQMGLLLSSLAGEPIYFATHDGQDALILGRVIGTGQSSIQFQPHTVISGKQIHSQITIRHPNPTTEFGNIHPSLKTGDLAIVSVNQEGQRYRLALGTNLVSSLNLETLKLTESTFRFDDRLMLQWYINSCGQAKDFASDGATLSVKLADGGSLAIARRHKKAWVPLRKAGNLYSEACRFLAVKNALFAAFPWLLGILGGSSALTLIYRMLIRQRQVES